MKFLIFQFSIVTVYFVAFYLSSGRGVTMNLILTYMLFSGPFLLLIASGIMVSQMVANVLALCSFAFVLLGALLIITDQALLVLPAFWSILFIGSVAVFIVSLLYKAISYYISVKNKT